MSAVLSCTVQAMAVLHVAAVRVRAMCLSCLLILVGLNPLSVKPAAAQGVGQGDTSPPRTVSWYTSNPQSRARVELACLDDPGRLGMTPDCINAHQAGVSIALENAKRHLGNSMNPNDPSFWSADPDTRRAKLIMCRRNPELDHCDVAKRSLLIEAGMAPRR